MNPSLPSTALIGFGEAGSIFARAGGWGNAASAWDLKPGRRALAGQCGFQVGSDAHKALAGARLVLSLVTADQALAAARQYAPFLETGTIWCDMNSVAPQTKRAAAEAVTAAGGRYVDVAVMAPVDPAALSVPLLLAGEHADEALDLLGLLGFRCSKVVGSEIGRASAIKMIRSVMIKGIEALTDEMMAAAEAAGVADEVLASLDASEKAQKWTSRAVYNRERMATHGLRRAVEMEESAETLRGLGVEPVMTTGTVRRQREAARATKANKDAA